MSNAGVGEMMVRNVFCMMALLAGMWILSSGIAHAADVIIDISVSKHKIYVSINGESKYTWPEATGRVDHETPRGKFHVVSLDADAHSEKYDNAPMPHAIYFKGHEYAIHGHAGKLGQSHGCVRLRPGNAKTLWDLVSANRRTTTIYIN